MNALAIMGLGPQELIIILVIVLLLFGGSRLAGLGKSSGRALKEFKEETKGLRDTKDGDAPATTTAQSPQGPVQTGPVTPTYQPYQQVPDPQQPHHDLADPTVTDARKDV